MHQGPSSSTSAVPPTRPSPPPHCSAAPQIHESAPQEQRLWVKVCTFHGFFLFEIGIVKFVMKYLLDFIFVGFDWLNLILIGFNFLCLCVWLPRKKKPNGKKNCRLILFIHFFFKFKGWIFFLFLIYFWRWFLFIYLLKWCYFLRSFTFFYIIKKIWEDYIILFSHEYANYIIC